MYLKIKQITLIQKLDYMYLLKYLMSWILKIFKAVEFTLFLLFIFIVTQIPCVILLVRKQGLIIRCSLIASQDGKKSSN